MKAVAESRWCECKSDIRDSPEQRGKTFPGSVFQVPLRQKGQFSFLAFCHTVSWAAVSHVYSSHC